MTECIFMILIFSLEHWLGAFRSNRLYVFYKKTAPVPESLYQSYRPMQHLCAIQLLLCLYALQNMYRSVKDTNKKNVFVELKTVDAEKTPPLRWYMICFFYEYVTKILKDICAKYSVTRDFIRLLIPVYIHITYKAIASRFFFPAHVSRNIDVFRTLSNI